MKRFRYRLNRTEEKSVVPDFSFLAGETVEQILRYLRWPTDFYMLSLVCRMFYHHATPKLYAILVIAYRRPARIGALLKLLRSDPERVKFVTTLLFDEDVKSIGPNLQSWKKWPTFASRGELTDGWDPASADIQFTKSYPNNGRHNIISRRLRDILPTLCNLQRVVIRNLHPMYTYPGFCKDSLGPDAHSIENSLSSEGDVNSISNTSVWRYIVDGSPQLTELFVNGVPRGRFEGLNLSALTIVGISDLFYGVDGHTDAARLWNTVLSGASNLKTLAMVHVQQVPIILEELLLPRLEALELFIVYLCAPHETDSSKFVDFLYRHSPTLLILAVSCPMWSTVDHTRWLSDKYILPKLHTLRLNHTMALLNTVDELTAFSGTARQNVSYDAVQARKTEILFEFIRQRPGVLDVGIASLKRPEADEFARFLTSTRRMRNVFIGETAEQSLLNHMVTRGCTHRYWAYGYDAWAFYELFGGLAITNSGFRPRLPPRRWEFWKKITLW